MQNELKLSFIGGGNMANALIGGLLSQPGADARISVIDPNPEALQKLAQQFGVATAAQIDAALVDSDVIVLAVKPQQMREVAVMLAPHLNRQLVISIAAGIRMADLAEWLGGHAAIVRCMPNTPALIAQGITGMVASAGVSAAQQLTADEILRAVGATVWVEREALIDSVTAVSGSGPAYVFYFIEAMQQAALELGLTAEQGNALAVSTFCGAAQLAAKATEPIATLRQRVTSAGGTTHAAITSMEESEVKQAIVDAIKAAAARSRELGEEFGAS
ncbi:pyrroline-5-carboxylate reductase [Actimicrobium sp. GrIS 1.19]|uniref:pyrroline-5-carboxylate reductase n=1 Tax=Actimicrobium sp. GrIS 1.19 TaxID=3071708 RepID=UPI002DF79AB9|nr:pyrroline-5-carboxylate reductase [Actimicrobium sp. GrIS 1.19]